VAFHFNRFSLFAKDAQTAEPAIKNAICQIPFAGASESTVTKAFRALDFPTSKVLLPFLGWQN